MDQYKVSTTTNSCSTMHKITDKPFSLEDFSFSPANERSTYIFDAIIAELEELRKAYLNSKDKKYWYSLIQMLPEGYNQLRTWTADYAVLRNIYFARRNHKLYEWQYFCNIIEMLPYSELIILEAK